MEGKGFQVLKLEMKLKIFQKSSSPKTSLSLLTHLNASSTQVTEFRIEKTINHQLFIKKNKSKDTNLPNGRTLFISNLPLDASNDVILNLLFQNYGDIVHIVWPAILHTGGTCHIVFKDTESISAILELDSLVYPEDSIGRIDYSKIIKRPDTAAFKDSVDQAMELFDEQIEEEDDEVIDSEGFTLVRKSKKKVAGSVQSITKIEAENLRKPKPKELDNFYRFQKREKKQKELRKRFENDKRTIETMKAQRKFKPY